MQHHAMPWNTMQYHAYYAIPCSIAWYCNFAGRNVFTFLWLGLKYGAEGVIPGGTDHPRGLLLQHGSSSAEEVGEIPGSRQRHRGKWLQVLQHPPGNWDKRSDQFEEQGRSQSPVPGHEDQEDQQPDNNLQQARPIGVLYSVERHVLHRLDL